MIGWLVYLYSLVFWLLHHAWNVANVFPSCDAENGHYEVTAVIPCMPETVNVVTQIADSVQKYSEASILVYIFHRKQQIKNKSFWNQFLSDFDKCYQQKLN